MQNIKIFFQKTNYQEEDVLNHKNIHQGYTNKNWLITTKDNHQFIIRIPLRIHDFINEKNAYLNYQKVKFIDFDVKSGVYIKKLIPGNHPDLINSQIIEQVVKEINFVHNIKFSFPIITQDWFEYIDYNVLDFKILSIFYKLVKETENDPKVFTHHDLNVLNMLQTAEKIIFIDWEWARLDSPYFDYATLVLNDKVDENLVIKLAKLDFQKLQKYKFLILVFSHMWCNYMNTPVTLELKNKLLDNIQQMLLKIM